MNVLFVVISMFFIFSNDILCQQVQEEIAFSIVPVMDLVGDSFSKPGKTQSVALLYSNLPLCGKNASDCLRIHQLLFNERVTILEDNGEEVLIRVPSVYFESEKNDEKVDTYWALKKNFITLNSLRSKGLTSNYFPDPIDYKQPHQHCNKKTVVLIEPFHDASTNYHFSAGTRFVLDISKTNRAHYGVYVFNAKKNRLMTILIPRPECLLESKKMGNDKRIELYVSLLKRWANTNGIIPYVWGGCSFVTTCKNNTFMVQESNNQEKKLFYYRPELIGAPKTGFDCTGLMMRAAQIAGLPYFFKNSTTIKKNLQELTDNDSINPGDVLWFPGHVMVVSDLTANKLIEARAYNAGFGKVQEVLLSSVFKGVNSYAQLKDLFLGHKKLQRLNSKGEPVQIIDEFKILKLSSLWHKK